jgi:hypothetical protein
MVEDVYFIPEIKKRYTRHGITNREGVWDIHEESSLKWTWVVMGENIV